MIERALRYQTQGEEWVKRVAIGGGVVFLANLVFLPIFTVYGYMLEVMRRTLEGETDTPPEWGAFDIAEVSIDGAKAFVILFAYTTAVGLLVLVPSGVVLLLSLVLESGVLGVVAIVVGGVLSLLGAVIIAIIAPVAIGNFAVSDDLSAGFDVGVLWRLGTNRKLLRAAGLAILVNLLANLVSGVLLLTIVGPAVVTFVGFSAIAVIWANGFAEAYRESYGELPEIPDGPVKQTDGDNLGASVTAMGSTAAGGDGDATDTPADTDGGTGDRPNDESADGGTEDGAETDDERGRE